MKAKYTSEFYLQFCLPGFLAKAQIADARDYRNDDARISSK